MSETVHHNGKLMYWILGFLATCILAVSGLMASHQLASSEAIHASLSGLEKASARNGQRLVDIERRINRLENAVDELRDEIQQGRKR